ncbi:hypothetical protein NQ318_020594 [Aromia moschata]|uniref:Uncharacterized protein n=1 Tax=Aromia moschata TaxID=1265417 RepID=A0AAV8Z0Y1_9CUCU|nr:hypothetical protein NQ318_020594 [Aromia moschata]
MILTMKLNISNNNINTLKPSRKEYPISEIDLSHNRIIKFSDSELRIKCSSLDISYNKLDSVQSSDYKHYLNIAVSDLDLSSSNISDIEQNAFKSLNCIKLVLSGNKLSNVKNKFNDLTVEVLDLSSNPLTIISNHSFAKCKSLTTLNFSNCVIERIETQAFSGLNDLWTVDLSYNKLYVLESNTFSNLPIGNLLFQGARIDTVQAGAFNNLYNLKVLNLTGVGIRSLDSFSFRNLSACKTVDLRNNKIPTVPQNLFIDTPSLRTVRLEGNNITTLNPFQKNIRLEFISISFNGVSKISGLCNMYLKALHIKDSKIPRLRNKTFEGCYQLTDLRVDNSYIGHVESSALLGLINLPTLDAHTIFNNTKVIRENMFQDLWQLQVLNLSYLSIERLESKSFTGMGSLQALALNNNELTELVDDTFYGLPSLTILDLSHNKINSLSNKTFRGLKNLKKLLLSFNHLTTIYANIFSKYLGSFEELHLDHNRNFSLNVDSFAGLSKLQKLYLQGNSIQDFPVGVFKHLPGLKLLNFSNNMLQLLKTGSFSNLEALTYLDLSNNELINLEHVHVFFSLKRLERVFLDDNHLKQFDVRRFLKNARKMKYLGIARNKWNCNTLSELVEILNSFKVSYKPGSPVYDDDNVDGVGCLDICKIIYCSHVNITDLKIH